MLRTHKTNIRRVSFALRYVQSAKEGISLHLLGSHRNLNKEATFCAGSWTIQTDISQQKRWETSLAEATGLAQREALCKNMKHSQSRETLQYV